MQLVLRVGCGFVVLSAMLVGSALAQNTPSRATPLSDLTVPSARLPEGCRLAAAPVLGIPTNPWIDTDRMAVASLRRKMGEVPTVTDAPLTRRDAARYELLLADGIEEGYAAVYGETLGQRTIVQALRFTGRPDDRSSMPPNTTRIQIGRIIVVVSGDRGECYRAVETYLKSLAT